jgi:hypothetical protein
MNPHFLLLFLTDSQVTMTRRAIDKCTMFKDSLLKTSCHSDAKMLTIVDRAFGRETITATFVSLK